MNQAIDEEEELRDTRYPKFRVMTGGKGPPMAPTDNWLAEYCEGTTFVSMRINSKDCDYELFHVMFVNLPDVMLLKWQLPDGKIWDKYVNPVEFSKMFKRGIVLGVIRKEEDNGNSNSCGPSDMVCDASVSGECPTPEDVGEQKPDL